MESYTYGDVVQREGAAVLVGLERKAVNQYSVPVKFAAVGAYLHLALVDSASVGETVVKTEPDLFCSHNTDPDLGLLLGYLTVYSQNLLFGQALEILLSRSDDHTEHVDTSRAYQNLALIRIIAVGTVLAARNYSRDDLTVTVECKHVHTRLIVTLIDGHS